MPLMISGEQVWSGVILQLIVELEPNVLLWVYIVENLHFKSFNSSSAI